MSRTAQSIATYPAAGVCVPRGLEACPPPDGSWGSLYTGAVPKALPLELAGLTIAVRTRSGKSWNATITEVVERTPARLLVRTRRLDH